MPIRCCLVLTLAASLLLATDVHDAAARRKKKSSVSATIDGTRRTWNAKKLTVDVAAGQVTVVATIKRPRLNRLIRGLSMSCQVDLAGLLPVTPTFPQLCVLGYSELRLARTPVHKTWGGSNFEEQVEVTFESRSGDTVTGRFRGTLASQIVPPEAPLVIEGGTFTIDVGG
jgi:hypothetical protein